MRKPFLLFLPLALAGVGCTAMSLERHAVNQSQSATDYRYRATLHALAMVAADPATLPSYALLSSGLAAVTDTGIVSTTSAWSGAPEVFASQALGITASRSPNLQWTVGPVADFTQLEAMRCACRWVLEGPEHLGPDCMHILADPEVDHSPGPHFGVTERLNRLPHGWLHVGQLCDIPCGACYKDHCGDTWVWVMPDGTEGLADFTLVLQDIGTLNVVDATAPANRTPPVLVTLWVVQKAFPTSKDAAPAGAGRPKEAPNADVVVIPIDSDGGSIIYAGNREVSVTVGQVVVWQNRDKTKAHTATDESNLLFDSGAINAGGSFSKPVVFGDAMYKGAGGKGENPVRITYGSRADGDKGSATIMLKPKTPQAKDFYPQTLVFRVDREVRPECQCEIEERMRRAMQEPVSAVDITWEDWMKWTKPYQGQRSSVKPGSVTAKPLTLPPDRLIAPPQINAMGVLLGPTIRGGRYGPSPNLVP